MYNSLYCTLPTDEEWYTRVRRGVREIEGPRSTGPVGIVGGVLPGTKVTSERSSRSRGFFSTKGFSYDSFLVCGVLLLKFLQFEVNLL